MRAAIFEQHGGTGNIRIVNDFPDPRPGPNEVVVRVQAVSLNGFDPQILAGTTGLKTPMPMIPGGDFAGEIVEMGGNAKGKGFDIGDRVCPHPFVFGEGMTGETRLGACAEYIKIPDYCLIRMPDGVSYENAASLPIAYGTAYRMMVTRGKVREGERVLILSATGGVGVCCLQLAKAAGAEVIVTGSAKWKLDKLRELGADHVIDTSEEDWVAAIHEKYKKPRMAAGGGVQVIVNYIGGDTWVKALKCLTTNGRMLVCGATAGYAAENDIRYIWTYEHNIIGSNGWFPEEQKEILAMVADGRLKPVIHDVRPLEATAQSIQDLIDRKVVGKIIIRPQG